jgi:hypothetical protein
MIPAAGTAAALTGGILWRWLVLKRSVVTRRRALLVGALVGLAAHPVAWYLLIVALYVTGARSSLGERTLDPWNGLWGALIYSAWSLFLAGWLTVPAGAIVGFLLSQPKPATAIPCTRYAPNPPILKE